MNWITVSWPMVAAACLTLGLIELRIGLAQRHQRAARLLFALSACAMAVACGLELALIQVDTLAQAEVLLSLLRVTIGVVLTALLAFVWSYFGAGNRWVALAFVCLYLIGVVGELMPGEFHTVHTTITGLKTHEAFGGAPFTVLERQFSFWYAFPYLATLMMIAFVVDASIRLWRRGGRRRALLIGGSITIFLLAGGVQAALVLANGVSMPYTLSWCYLAILVAMATDLSADALAATKLAEQLRESERRMALASAAVDLGMWSWDVADDRVWATDMACTLVGAAETGNMSMATFLARLNPDDREEVKRDFNPLQTEGQVYEAESRVDLPEGQMRWIALRAQVERVAKDRPVLMRGVVIDISQRRKADIELQQLQSQLAHAGRVTMMGQLASALAHELSQPLGAILRNTEAAELFLLHESPDLGELQEILGDIRQDNQRAGGVIERLRALLQRRSFDSRALSMSAVMDDVVALTRNDALARKVRLEIATASGPLRVMGDPVQLQQVLLNLVLNAMDAVSDLPLERRKVTVQAQRHGEQEVEVAVTDSGTGIAPERLVHLFQPFYTTKPSGLGIGLSISRTIVEAHGGRIWAENNAGEGAIFRFTLPLAKGVISA